MSNKNTQKPSHRVPLYRRPAVIISCVIILAIVVALTIWAFSAFFSHDSSSPSPNPGSSETNKPSAGKTLDSDSESDKPAEEPARPPQYEGEDPNELSGLTGSITLNTHDASTLTVAVSIDQYLVHPGTCQLRLLQNSQVLRTAEAQAVADVTTSGCGPFQVPISGLPPGKYQLEITISGDGKTGLVTGEVQI